MAARSNLVEHIIMTVDIEKSGRPGWGAVDTAYGFNNTLPFTTVTVQHPNKGKDLLTAMDDASFLVEGIKGCGMS